MNFYIKYFSLFMAVVYVSIGVFLMSTEYMDHPLKVSIAILCVVYGLYRAYRAYKAIISAKNE
jgi:hypothetical protein